jgi:murein DD-endopeptidase MepM/ murein hydrolase activator NlpD
MSAKAGVVLAAVLLTPMLALGAYTMFVLTLLGGASAASGVSGCIPGAPVPTSTPSTSAPPTATPVPGCAGEGLAVPPLGPGYNMTSIFGYRGDIGLDGVSDWHGGIDLQNPARKCGDPVYSVLPGTVILSSTMFLSIKHPDGFVVSYLHMYKSQRLVDVGDEVVAGQQIGITGNVQPSTGCHLDLRVAPGSTTNAAILALPRDPHLPAYVNPEDFLKLFGVDLCPKTCARP